MEENAARRRGLVGDGEPAAGDVSREPLIRPISVVARAATAADRHVIDGNHCALVLERVLPNRNAAGIAAVGRRRGDGQHRIIPRRRIPRETPAIALVAVLDSRCVHVREIHAAVGVVSHVALDLTPQRVAGRYPALFEIGHVAARKIPLRKRTAEIALRALLACGQNFRLQRGELRREKRRGRKRIKVRRRRRPAEEQLPSPSGAVVCVLLVRCPTTRRGHAPAAVLHIASSFRERPVHDHPRFVAHLRILRELRERLHRRERVLQVVMRVVLLVIVERRLVEDVQNEVLPARVADAVGGAGDGVHRRPPHAVREIRRRREHEPLIRR